MVCLQCSIKNIIQLTSARTLWTQDKYVNKLEHMVNEYKDDAQAGGEEKLKKQHNLITNLQMCIQTNAFTVNCWVGISREEWS